MPKLVVDGYNGPLYMKDPTGELLEVMLIDAATLQQRDTEWENKRRQSYCGKAEIEPEPAYTMRDCIAYFVRREIVVGVEICFRDAGHILGSAIVEIFEIEYG